MRLVEAALAQLTPAIGFRAGDEQQRGLHLLLDAAADDPERHDDDRPADEHGHRVAHGKARDRRDQAVRPVNRGASPGSRTTAPPPCPPHAAPSDACAASVSLPRGGKRRRIAARPWRPRARACGMRRSSNCSTGSTSSSRSRARRSTSWRARSSTVEWPGAPPCSRRATSATPATSCDSGRVKVMRRLADGQRDHARAGRAGRVVGELALLEGDRRSASMETVEPTTRGRDLGRRSDGDPARRSPRPRSAWRCTSPRCCGRRTTGSSTRRRRPSTAASSRRCSRRSRHGRPSSPGERGRRARRHDVGSRPAGRRPEGCGGARAPPAGERGHPQHDAAAASSSIPPPPSGGTWPEWPPGDPGRPGRARAELRGTARAAALLCVLFAVLVGADRAAAQLSADVTPDQGMTVMAALDRTHPVARRPAADRAQLRAPARNALRRSGARAAVQQLAGAARAPARRPARSASAARRRS